MALNDRLRDALSASGLTPNDIATRVGVDPRTAERWITLGRNPYPKHRHQIAAILRESETYLWPSAMNDAERNRAAESEILHVYPHRAGIPADMWSRLFDSASENIDVLVYAGLFLPEQQPRLMATLCEKSDSGVGIRFLFGDPDCEQVAQRSAEEGIGDAIAAKIRNVLIMFRSHARQDCLDIRLHRTTLYSSLYRFDDEMLVNTHVYGLPAAHAPVMHLRRLSAGDLFSTYANTFERIWSGAFPARSDSEVA